MAGSSAARPFTAARLRTFAAHVLDHHGFTVAHRHLNLASLMKDHRFNRIVAAELEAEGLASWATKQTSLWAYWELLLHKQASWGSAGNHQSGLYRD